MENIIEALKAFCGVIGEFLVNLGIPKGSLSEPKLGAIAVGALFLLLVIIVIIVAVCVSKKAKKAKAAQAKVEEVPEVKEEDPVEAKEDAVEDAKEEVVEEEAQEEVSQEKTVEEPVTEETTVEETTEEKVEEAEEEPAAQEVPQAQEDDEATIIVDEDSKAELIEAGEIKEEPKKEAKPAPKKAPAKKTAPKKDAPAPVKEPKEAKGKYVLVQEGPNWRYNLKASNGEVIIVSEPYASEKAVRSGIETLKKNVETARCEIVEDKHGLFSFMVITKQGRCLATSANYKARARAVSASESYKRWAVSETIIVDDNQDKNHMEVEVVDVQIEEANNGTYIIKESEHGFIYQLLAANKRVVATSQSYKTKASCLEALEKFRLYVYEGVFYVYKDKNSKFQFKLYNKQNRLVLAGEVYDDKARVISVIEAIKRLAKQAKVISE